MALDNVLFNKIYFDKDHKIWLEYVSGGAALKYLNQKHPLNYIKDFISYIS